MPKKNDKAFVVCINPDCGRRYDCAEVLFKCPVCGELLDVCYDWERIEIPARLGDFLKMRRRSRLSDSGVWQFGALLDFCDDKYKVTVGEGRTILQRNNALAAMLGIEKDNLYLQYEGLNPSGSFKDNGMAAAFSHARMAGASACACASTGNTSASMALYAQNCGMKATVFVGSGKIAYGKLSQAMDYGARTLQIKGDFDDCMRQVQDVCGRMGIYLVNSLNPFRLEGQKTIVYRILEQLNGQIPDWIIVPGGNLGNSGAFGKALMELRELGLIDRMPRLAVIVAAGADTLSVLYNRKGLVWNNGRSDNSVIEAYYKYLEWQNIRPQTCASAIEIARPVNLKKCLRALDACSGIVMSVEDRQILDAKAMVGITGFGCEPASAASVAGLKVLVENGTVEPGQRCVCVLTGHLLKDPDATVGYHTKNMGALSNPPVEVENDIEKILDIIKRQGVFHGMK